MSFSFPQSERLIFRAWKAADFEDMFRMTSNEQTQRYFLNVHTREIAQGLFDRLRAQYDKWGYTYFPVFEKSTNEFIGFIGCAWQKEIHELCPFVDIGWRLLPEYWGKGYATEGAIACMTHVFEHSDINAIYAMATQANLASFAVMKKLGMEFLEVFEHPKLKDNPDLATCDLYKITRSQWSARAQP